MPGRFLPSGHMIFRYYRRALYEGQRHHAFSFVQIVKLCKRLFYKYNNTLITAVFPAMCILVLRESIERLLGIRHGESPAVKFNTKNAR